MGNSIIQNMAKNTDGLLLLESFESVNFMADQAWTLINGVPVTTNVVAFSGLRSLLMDLTYPLIQKTFTSFDFSAGYFFDDAAVPPTAIEPFLVWENSGGGVWGIGVRQATSLGFYTMIINGVLTATAKIRTTGWHRFAVVRIGGLAQLTIDGVAVGAATASTTFTKVRVGARVVAGITAFGYFDLIQVNASPFFNVGQLNAGQVMTLLAADGTTLIASAPSVAGTASVNVSALDQPFVGIVKVSRPDGINPFFYAAAQSLAAGDLWNLNVFDLGRRVPAFKKARAAARTDLEASSGINQSLFYYSRDIVSMTLSSLTDDQAQDLQRWWGYAKGGNAFSAAIDSDEVYVAPLLADTTTGATITVPNPANGANRNAKLMLTRANGQAFSVGEVLSIAAGVITFKSPLVQKYLIGDQVRNSYYWPSVISTDMSFEPMLIHPKIKRWTVTISFKEAL